MSRFDKKYKTSGSHIVSQLYLIIFLEFESKTFVDTSLVTIIDMMISTSNRFQTVRLQTTEPPVYSMFSSVCTITYHSQGLREGEVFQCV